MAQTKKRWIAWALLNCIFFSLEILFKQLVKKKFPSLSSRKYYRYLVGLAGTFDVYLLFIANLAIGYGFNGIPPFLTRAFLTNGEGLQTFCLGSICIFMGVMVMQELRRYEEFHTNTVHKKDPHFTN